MTEHVDWQPRGASRGLVVLLPGRGYTPAMPLLAFARQVALQHGWTVREVWWEAPDLDEEAASAWAAEELRAATHDHAGPVRVVAKSLGTRVAPYAAERGHDAVWLTPILVAPVIAAAIGRHPGRQLVVGGTADDLWDGEVAARLGCPVLEVPGADHALSVPDDAVRTVEIHLEVTRALDAFFRAAR